MKTRVMKKKFRRMLCASMAAIFVMSDMIPVASAQGTAAETLPAPTDIERIVGFEMVNPLNSYEIKAGESLESLDTPEKIRVIVELPEDTRLSTFEEGEAPEQTDDTLPAYEYSHTLEQLSMSSEEDTASSGEEAAPSGEDTASSEDSSGTATSEDPSSAQEPSYTEEEIAEIYQESLTKKLGTVNVYALTDNAGASQYRVYGSIDAQAPQWYAIDENGVMLGAVEELDANWDFTGFDSTVAGEHQVKAQLPENYILSESVEMACLQIVVTQEEEEQSSIENEDGSLPDSLPVSYIQALRAQQPRVSTATFPIKVVREGFGDDDSHTFAGGEITSANVPSIDKYIFKEERSNDGSLISNGARLVVTENGVATAYSNVSGLYNVQQTDGSYKWYYTTVTPENAVAWAVPENAYLELTYIPDPSQPNQFKTIKVQSNNWWDGTVNGASQNYTIQYPVGTQVSIKVDLPTLYSNFTPKYTGIAEGNVQVTKTNATNYATDVGYHGNEYPIYDTATFNFAVPSSDVTIDLTFSSYAKKNGTGELQPINLRMGQGYPTFWHNGTAYNWRGYKMVRLYEWEGRPNVTMKPNGLPAVNNVSKLPRAYQIYGPDTPPQYGTIGPGTAEPWRPDTWITGSGTKNNPRAAQPNMHKDASVQNGRYPDVNQFNYDSVPSGGGGVYTYRTDSVQSKVQNTNGASTLAYVYENTLYNDNPNYNGDSSMSGRTMPVGVMIYTQKSSKGTFVPLETEYALAGTSAVNDTTQKVLSTVKVDGMTVTVTRNYFRNISYSASLNPHPNGNWRQEWMYLVTVQGATGYLGVHFVTVPDTQWALNVANVSSNIKKADILTTSGNDTASETRKWYTLGSGGYYFGYQFGDNNSTDFPQFYDGNWNTTYLNRDGGVGLRLYRKDGFGIPYLKFNITSNGTPQTVRAGINDVTLNSGTNTGKTTVNYLEGNNKKVVEGRAKKINNDTVYDFLFGFKDSSGSDTAKTNWGKSITVSVESDPMQIGYQVDLKGGNWSGKNKVIWPYGNNSYVVIPDQTPTKSGTTFRGWKVKLADGTYLKDPSAPNTDLRLQPGQIIPTTDSTYIPLDKLKLDHGVNFKSNTDVTGTGYYNTMVLQLEAVYNSTVQEGDIITAPIKVYTQKDAGVNTGEKEDYATLSGEYTEQPNLEKAGYAPWKHEYFVNYADSILVGNSKYLLNDSLSLVKGKAGETKNSNNEYILGYLRYDKVVNVAYNIETDGKPDTGPTAPTDAGEYTTVNGHNNSITLKTPAGSYSADTFEGWKITYQDGSTSQSVTIPKNIRTLVLDGNQSNASSTSGTTMTIGGQAAAAIYNDGVINLEAQWADAMQRITLPGGSMSGSQEVKLYQSPYSISATFNMASAVSAGSTVDFAIYISRPNGAWGIAEIGRVDLATETITRPPTNKTANRFFENLKDASFDVNVQKGAASTDITLNVSGITDLTGNRKTYRIYMWNSKNGNANLWNNGNLGDIISYIYRDNLDAFTPVADYPYMDLTLRQIPKVQVTESKKDKLFYEGQSFTVSGTFSLEDQKDTFDQIHTDNANTEIKAALYKVNPPGDEGNYAIWATNAGAVQNHQNKVSAPTIQKVSDTEFTVSFTITDSSGSISNKWDDGAKYRVFAWTGSNERITANPDFGQEGDAFPVKDNITTIPSTTTTMAGVLGQQVESIIHYPKQITMLDNVVPNNKHIFSGNEKITIQPTLNDGRSAEIPDSDIGVDVVIRELNGNQTFNITRGTETIPLKGFIGTVGKGSAIPSNGKMGTLKFDPDNNSTQDLLQFYFRSATPPTVADGPAFEGTIHFEFSNGSGTTN